MIAALAPPTAGHPININIWWLCGLTFVLAAVACALVTPLVRRMAFAVGVFDEPDPNFAIVTP